MVFQKQIDRTCPNERVNLTVGSLVGEIEIFMIYGSLGVCVVIYVLEFIY